MVVKVRLFAVLAEIAGERELEVELPEGATGEDLCAALARRYPQLLKLKGALRLAVNQEYVPWDTPLRSGDETAFIPPVSGGSGEERGAGPSPFVEVVTGPLSADRYQSLVVAPECGAVAIFVGVVREFTEGRRTVYLRYEAYAEMAEREMRKIAAEIMERWPDSRVAIGHRVGELGVGEASVIVAVATPHRRAAFEAAQFGIDTLKERVPIWKKEIWDDGESWVGIDA